MIKKKKISDEVIAFLKQPAPYFDSFKRNWRRFNILMPIVNEFERQVDPHWEEIRIEFFESVLLPLARTEVTSKDWTRRLCAARTFSLYFEAGDEPYILKLAEDKVPLVRYNSIIPAVLYGSEKCINSIITKIAEEPFLSQYIYLREFYNASGTSRIHIENCLINSSEPNIRYVCYKLLLNYPALGISWDYQGDLISNNLQLKLATLTYLCHANRGIAIPIITNSLKDTDWNVRVVALICLRNMKVNQAIPDISRCLKDSNQTVILVAKQVLYELGEQGVQALESQNIAYKPIALDLENQFLLI